MPDLSERQIQALFSLICRAINYVNQGDLRGAMADVLSIDKLCAKHGQDDIASKAIACYAHLADGNGYSGKQFLIGMREAVVPLLKKV